MKNLFLTLVTLFVAGSALANGGPAKSVDVSKSTIEWKATKITGSHEGTLALADGSLNFTDDGVLEGGFFTVDMNSLDVTDLEGEWKDKLVGHLRSDDFFSIDKHGTATMKITGVSNLGQNKYSVNADLTIKGITKPVTFEASIGDNQAMAAITIDRTEFDIRYGSGKFFDNLGDKTIHDEFTLNVNLIY